MRISRDLWGAYLVLFNPTHVLLLPTPPRPATHSDEMDVWYVRIFGTCDGAQGVGDS